jgi:hypothetical protein
MRLALARALFVKVRLMSWFAKTGSANAPLAGIVASR